MLNSEKPNFIITSEKLKYCSVFKNLKKQKAPLKTENNKYFM